MEDRALVSGWDDPTDVATLPLDERRVLATLAVVGRASLSTGDIAELLETDDVRPLIEDLRRRGLVQREEDDRVSAVEHVAEKIRDTDDALSAGERLLGHVTTLAEHGALTPDRLAKDAEAILGLTEWAAEHEEWARLLELVKTLQACFDIAHRVQEWIALLERGREAAHALGDTESEAWLLQQQAKAEATSGNSEAAERHLREADRLRRSGRSAGLSGGQRLALWSAGLAVAAAAGLGAGYALGGDGDNAGATIATVPVTVSLSGTTGTVQKTVELPATTATTTVLDTTTVLETTTLVSTETVTIVG